MMRTEPIKPCHGGTRQGAGRKAAYGEPTKTVRVPQSLAPFVVDYLDELKLSPQALGETPALRPIAALRTATAVSALGRRVRVGKPTSGDDYQEDLVVSAKQPAFLPTGYRLQLRRGGWVRTLCNEDWVRHQRRHEDDGEGSNT